MKSLKLRELVEKHRSSLVYDFRTFYNLSLYDCVNGLISIREFYDLMSELLKTPGSRTRADEFDVEEFSITDWNLIRVYNAIIASMDAKPIHKKKFIYEGKKPKSKDNNKKKKRQMTLKDLERIKIAKPEEEKVEKIIRHIDKKGVVRKCRANGLNCKVSDEHFEQNVSKTD